MQICLSVLVCPFFCDCFLVAIHLQNKIEGQITVRFWLSWNRMCTCIFAYKILLPHSQCFGISDISVSMFHQMPVLGKGVASDCALGPRGGK